MKTARHRDGFADMARRAVNLGWSRDKFLQGVKPEFAADADRAFSVALKNAVDGFYKEWKSK